MSDALEKLQHELEAAQRALAEAKARYVRQEAEHQSAIRKAENTRKQIEQAHQEWMSALDAVEDPIFVHDKEFRILRCNQAYQRSAGIPFKQIIGQPYYEVFPKIHAPLHNCRQALEKNEAEAAEEEILVGDTSYRSRAYSVRGGRGVYLYSVHTLENISESKRINKALRESELQYRRLFEAAKDGILILDAETGKVLDANPFILDLLSYSFQECIGKMLWEIGLFKDVKASKAAFRELQLKKYIRYEDLPLQTKDGRQIDVEFVSNCYAVGEQQVIQCNVRDITERILAKQLLQASEMQYRRLFEAAQDGILILDAETGKIQDANSFILELLSYRLDELMGKMLWEVGLFKDIEASKEAFEELKSIGHVRYEDLPLQTKDGRRVDVEFVSNLYVVGEQQVIQCNIRDITERKANEVSLKIFRTLIDKSNDAIEVLDPATLRFIDVNETACRTLGYSRKELLSMDIHDIDPEVSKMQLKKIDETLQAHGSITFETSHRRKDGSTFPAEVSISQTRIDREYRIAVVRDITERKRAEQAIRENEAQFRSIAISAQDAILMMDNEGKITYWNRAAENIFGYSEQEVVGQALHELLAPERFLVSYRKGFSRFRESGEGAAVGKMTELSGLRKDGTELPIELSLSAVQRNGQWYAIGIIRDISERKHAEEALKRSNRALKTLSAGNIALVQATDEDKLLQAITNVIVKQAGYVQAAVDYAEDDPEKRITPMAWSGFEGSHYWAEHLSWADTKQGQLPIAKAIRSGKTQVCHDIASNPAFKPWKERAAERGYVSNIALPMSDGKRIFGGLSIYTSDANAFDDEEVRLLEELANDLAYGIVSLRTRKEHEQHATILRQSLEQSIQTIAATVEARDPYTAGHQQRVGELATAIAREMALPEGQINGIHLAAIIHDLGKIHVPAEILSKPGRLTDIELMLIRTHPQDGYDILKDVNFPWPIADIILQHHEKLDGSGYPQGLKGEQILPESRILTVADIVEAMSSHRPYRAALGIEPALAEISRGRGCEYDPAVVDACIKLFAEKGFAFSSQAS